MSIGDGGHCLLTLESDFQVVLGNAHPTSSYYLVRMGIAYQKATSWMLQIVAGNAHPTILEEINRIAKKRAFPGKIDAAFVLSGCQKWL